MNNKNKQTQAVKTPLPREVKSFKDKSTLVIVLILLITAIVFSNTLNNGFIITWDDDGYVISNPLIREISLKTIFTVPHLDNYHPFTTLSNAIEFKFFGLNPKPYHAVNLILHLLNVFLVFRFIKMLSGRLEVAAITALFFGIHPMHVESVSWIAERKDVLYTFFFMSCLICYLRYIENSKSKYFVAALGLFLCSLFSKSAAVALAPLLLLVDYYTERKMSLKIILEKIPFFTLALIFGIVAVYTQRSSGATNMAPSFPVYDRIFLASYALVFYLIKFIAPTGLSPIHLYPEKIDGMFPWEYYIAPLVLLLIVWGIYKAGRYRKDLLFGMIFFLITLLLVIQIIPVGRAIVSDRYSYIPYIGLLFIAGKMYCSIIDNEFVLSKKLKPYANPVIIGFALILIITTWNRNKDWKDSNTLFTKAIETDPSNKHAYYTRGIGKALSNDFSGAVGDYTEAIRIKPSADVYYNRGVANEKINAAEAIADYTETIRLKPKHKDALFNRGNMKINSKDYQGAIADYNEVIKISPDYPEVYCNRGFAKFSLGNNKESIIDYDKAIQLNSKFSYAFAGRGSVEYTLGDTSKACDDFRKALQYGYPDAKRILDEYCK